MGCMANAVDKLASKSGEITIGDIRSACEEAGITLPSLFKRMAQGVNAKKVITNKFGDVSEEDDLLTSHKYVELSLKVLKVLDKDIGDVVVNKTNIVMTSENVDLIGRIWEEVSELKRVASTDKRHMGKVIDVTSR